MEQRNFLNIASGTEQIQGEILICNIHMFINDKKMLKCEIIPLGLIKPSETCLKCRFKGLT